MEKQQKLQMDRLIFFSDGIIAIAITLLSFNLKIAHHPTDYFSFSQLLEQPDVFIAFFLSFLLIAAFWWQHHQLFAHVAMVDNLIFWLNIFWLMFIVLIPFTTTILSRSFKSREATEMYCANIFVITLLQYLLWYRLITHPPMQVDLSGAMLAAFGNATKFHLANSLLAFGASWISLKLSIGILFVMPIMKDIVRYIGKRLHNYSDVLRRGDQDQRG